MPYKVTWEPRGAYTRLTDVVTGNCLLQNINEICADPRFDMLRYHIIDCRNADHFDVRDDDLRHGSALLIGAAQTNPDIKVAVVADSAPVHAMWTRLLELGITPYPPAIHRDLAAARKWIDDAVGQDFRN